MVRRCAWMFAVLAPAASLEMNSRLLQRAVRRHLGNAAAVAAVATAGPAALALEFSVAPEPPPPAANAGGFGLPLPSMPSMPSMGMPSMPSLPTPSLPSLPSFPAAPETKGQGGDIARGLDLPPLPPLFAPGTAPSLPSFPVLPKEEPAPPAEDTRAVEARRRAEALAAPTPKDEGAAPAADGAPAEALPFSLPSPSNLPSVAGPGAIWGGLGGNDAAAPKRDEGPALSLPSLPKMPSLPSFPVAPAAPAAPAAAPGLSLPKLPGVPGLPALPQVEINPIANIAVERPSVPDDAAPIEYADLVKKARLGGVTKVEFLSANGDVAVATLSDGSLRSIKVVDDKSGSYKLAAKMRDYGVPYTYSFNLGKFNEAAKRTSMRSKNQNVLDAEARQRDEDARLAALDARLAAESAPPAEAAPAAPAE